MDRPWLLLVASGGLLAVAGGPATQAATSAPTPPGVLDTLRKSWTGQWSCTETVTNRKPEHWSETVTTFGDKWIKTVGTYPATKTQSATPFESLFGYDRHRHQWVNVTILSDGTYGIDRGTTGANARTIVWVNAYPVTTKDSATQTVTAHGYTVDGSYKEKGRTISFHWDCARR